MERMLLKLPDLSADLDNLSRLRDAYLAVPGRLGCPFELPMTPISGVSAYRCFRGSTTCQFNC